MPVDEKTLEALKIENLEIPASLGVRAIEVEDYTDYYGGAGLRVTVVIDEEVDVEHVPGKDVLQFKGNIHESLLARGIEYFPYVYLIKESERQEDRIGE